MASYIQVFECYLALLKWSGLDNICLFDWNVYYVVVSSSSGNQI